VHVFFYFDDADMRAHFLFNANTSALRRDDASHPFRMLGIYVTEIYQAVNISLA